MNEDVIKLRIRRFNAHDETVLRKMLKSHQIAWSEIDIISGEMISPHIKAVENINQHLWELANIAPEEK